VAQDRMSDNSAASALDDDSHPTAEQEDTKLVRDDELMYDMDPSAGQTGRAHRPPSPVAPQMVAAPMSEPYRTRRELITDEDPTRTRYRSTPPPMPPPRAVEPRPASAGAGSPVPREHPSAAAASARVPARQREATWPSVPIPSPPLRNWPADAGEARATAQYYAGEPVGPFESERNSVQRRGAADFGDSTLMGFPASEDGADPLHVSDRVRAHAAHSQHDRMLPILREGDVVLGRYRVIHVVEDGPVMTADVVRLGFGSAAQAVVLKADGLGTLSAHEHLIRTARMVAQLQSEHVARILDLSTSRSRVAYVVSERPGVSDLSDLLRMRGALTVSEALDYIVQIADALAQAHAYGISHGSLRPARVFVSESADGGALLKVTGFGVLGQWSLLSTTASLQTGEGLDGALRYLAPEQIRTPDRVDTRCDIWALGLLLHEMLTGVTTFRGSSSAAALAMIVADPVPSITAVRPDVPRALESVVMRCLEKRPDARFANVAELVRALKPLVPAETQGAIERIVRISARSPRSASTLIPPQNALVHLPTRDGFGSASPPSLANAQGPHKTVHLGMVIALVVVTGALAGVLGAVFIARLPMAPTRTLTQEAPPSQAQPIPQTASGGLQPVQGIAVAQPVSEGAPNPASATAPVTNQQQQVSGPPRAAAAPSAAQQKPFAQGTPHKVAMSPPVVKQVPPAPEVRQPEVKTDSPARDHLFDDIN